MPNRLRQLFRRYAAQHQSIQSPGYTLRDETGRVVGCLEEIEIRHNRLWVAGWILAEQVALVSEAERDEVVPNLSRPDMVQAKMWDVHGNAGFRLDLGMAETGAMLCARIDGTLYNYPIPDPQPKTLRNARRRLLFGFAMRVARAVPSILRWRVTRDPAQKARIKDLLGLADISGSVQVLPARLFRQSQAATVVPAVPVTLIMPVYNAFELLPEALGRVVRHTDLPWHLVLVEDKSSDGRVRPFLHDWAAEREIEEAGRITLIENSENHGFIESVNTALVVALKRGHHVVMLNSDALVPSGWATRLLYPILTGNRVASVTPMSNAAEIFSVPKICRAEPLLSAQADAIDAVAARFNPETAVAEAPTGVGFCMALNIYYLRCEPRFDETFGYGYGEEVDWCQRVRARGGRHLGTAGLFVEHRSGSSFGDDRKQALIAQNNATISRRYPDYDIEVQAFIRSDPLAPQRLTLALALATERQDGPLPIYLAHSLGGGAENCLCDRIVDDLVSGGSAVVLRVGGSRRWQIELHSQGGVTCGTTDDFDLIEALLDPVRCRHVVYSCGVGELDPMTLPERLVALRRTPRDTLEIQFHDFFPLSPSYTLLDSAGVFSGVPAADNPDPAHSFRRRDGSYVPLSQWRDAWGRAVAAADELVTFSKDSTAHVLAAYPGAAQALVLRPHQSSAKLSLVPPPATPVSAQPVIGVLGNINFPKGAGVVVDLARILEGGDAGSLVLIGDIDPEYQLPDRAHLHGRYRINEIPLLAARYGITHWLIPSIWPETFSFTTREALATGLPVLCFDLGAQAEAVQAAPQGHVIPLVANRDPAEAVLERISKIQGQDE